MWYFQAYSPVIRIVGLDGTEKACFDKLSDYELGDLDECEITSDVGAGEMCEAIGEDAAYCQLVAGSANHIGSDLLQWGTTYTLIKGTCPRCTLCRVPCIRSGKHQLCTHAINLTAMSSSVIGKARQWIKIQGYQDGWGLETEFSEEELEVELLGVVSAWATHTDAADGHYLLEHLTQIRNTHMSQSVARCFAKAMSWLRLQVMHRSSGSMECAWRE